MPTKNTQPTPTYTVCSSRIERDSLLDILRGGAIILVLLGHIIQYSTPDFDNNVGFRFIYSFHMPLFFIISGIASALSEAHKPRSNFFSFAKAKSMQLIVPFLAWATISFTLALLQAGADPLTYYKNLIRSVDNGLWFLVALFWCQIISKLSEKIAQKIPIHFRQNHIFILELFFSCVITATLTINAKLLSGTYNFFGTGFLLKYLPFFLAGRLWQYNARPLPSDSVSKWLIISLFLLLLTFYHRVDGPVTILNALNTQDNNHVIKTIFYYMIGFTGSASFLLFTTVSNKKFPALVRCGLMVFGRRSLDIYAIQVYFFPLFGSVLGVAQSLVGIGTASALIRKSTIATRLLLGGK